jgi:acyl transferase domain-containing protein/NADPH:quinone reductase-like Zn-dependent oxidoreductase/acyl carrier protein
MRETPVTPVAVIGMACRLPGGIDSPDLLWESLLRGDDLIAEIPAERWDGDEYYDPEPGVPGRSVSRWGGFLDDIAGFDFEFFGYGEREATAVDPQHRLLLETSWEAIENAGFPPTSLADTSTGVFIGLSHDDYELVAANAGVLGGAYGFTGTALSMASGRIAYALRLHGPAITTDTACSTGLLSVHLACRSLHDGESDLALAGGCMVMLEPQTFVSASIQGMLSPTGRCHSFDVAADGFVRAEGCGVVLLKRLPDALRDGDRILGVVRGTAANHDGRTENISTPSLDAQVAVYQAALAAAGVGAETVDVVEAHGTGTPVGDPIEFGSLSAVYGADGHRCVLGSAKTNLGHSEAAAGIVGLIKAILQLRHGVVPPMLHFTRLPDDLARIESELIVPQAITPWPTNSNGTLRRAAVSSYGVSGTNVHAVLEQAPENSSQDGLSPTADTAPLLFAISASSAAELRRTSARLADWVETHRDRVGAWDLAYTLARRRAHRPMRTAVIASSLTELTNGLHAVAESDIPIVPAVGQGDRGPVWLFSGQGSQWAAMGAGLLATEPVFARVVAEAEPLIAREAGFSVTEAMSASETVIGIDRVQPTLFTMQVALAAAMQAYGVQPSAVIGHSLGEVAAAVVAGALSLEDGVRVICRRSHLCARLAGAGAMASVELPAHRVRDELAARGVDDVVVSVVASPQSTVIGGATDTVRHLVTDWEAHNVMAREVAVDVASHSPQVDPILARLADVLAELTPMTPKVPFYSATLDEPRGVPSWDADYWVDNLRHPVQFAKAVQAALEDGHRVFAELSPHPLLTRAVEQTAQAIDMPVQALAGMRRDQAVPHGLREFLAEVHGAGAAVDFAVLYPAGRLVDAPLPTWTHHRLLIRPDGHDHEAHGAHTVAVHPLLGAHVQLPEKPERHVWQADVGTAALPWANDHRVHDVPSLPGAAFCEMALAAARSVLGEASEVHDIRFEQMLLLDEQTAVTAVASVEAPGVVDFVVETEQDDERIRRSVAVLKIAEEHQDPPQLDVAALLEAHTRRVDGAELRQRFDRRGVQFGPAFAGLVAASAAEGEVLTVLAEVALPAPIRAQHSAYGIHPALLDACFQSVAAHSATSDASGNSLLLALGVRRLRLYGSARDSRYCFTRVTARTGAEVEADIDLLDEAGKVLLAVRGLRLGGRADGSSERGRVLSERLLTIDWQPQALPEVAEADAGGWLLVTTTDTEDILSVRLTDALKSHGAQCRTFHWPEDADHRAAGELLDDQLNANRVTGLVILGRSPVGEPDEQSLLRGREQVRHLVRIASRPADFGGEPPRLYLVTMHAQSVLAGDRLNLDQAGLRGLMRVIGSEHPQLRPTQIDLDNENDVEQMALEMLCDSEEDETAWRNGQRYAARLRPSPLCPDERRTATVNHAHDGMRLEVRTPGDLETLEFAAIDRIAPGPGQIEIGVTASSVNFADVLIAFGRHSSFDGRRLQLGNDFAGVVTRTGPDITEYQIGERVGGYTPGGTWRSFVTCDARFTAPVPPRLTIDQAAAVPIAYGTAWYGLHDLARMRSGDRVLIHSATGGVGQAAIEIARCAGAEIFATAGSPAKRELLHDTGIEHVYDSRTTEFADLIRRDTDGYGVDIVLNSLTGAAQRAGFELLSFGGRFVEIGKRDVYDNTRLGLYPFRRNLTFFYLDLTVMAISHPQQIYDLLRTVYKLTGDGLLALPQCTRYPIADAATAIRQMGAAEHTGKLVLSLPHEGTSSVVVPPDRARVFRPDSSYIITGGLGGLGLFLAAGMAAAGCGRIILTGRSEPNTQALKAIVRIRATGADIQVECGNVAEQATAARLVDVATATGLPLRGVLHAAAVVEDATLTNISDELIDRDWAPKVCGVWHLHNATAGQPLDWFCSFSSAAALLGSPGQGAYAAANSWLDAFTLWRRAQGLPATAIAWGAWAEIGRGASLAEGGQTTMITPEEGAYAFQMMLRHDRGYTGYVPIVGTPWLTALAQRSAFAEAFQAMDATAKATNAFREELRSLPTDEWPGRLRRLVGEQVSLILRRSVDPDRPFSDHGLDSLGNLELRTRIETETGIRVTPKAVATHNTVRALADHLSEMLSDEEAAEAMR